MQLYSTNQLHGIDARLQRWRMKTGNTTNTEAKEVITPGNLIYHQVGNLIYHQII
jgi:hypothetical protein